MILMTGRKVKKKKLEELKSELQKMDTRPGLAVIRVGDDEASKVYVQQKEKLAESIGYSYFEFCYGSEITESKLIAEINKLNQDPIIDGIIVQLPLPGHINQNLVINSVDPEKDVDGLTSINAGKLLCGEDSIIPCTPKGIIDLLDYYKIEISGKSAVVIGRSNLVGKPIAILLTSRNATVTLCHSKTENLGYYTRNADIIIVAVGKKHFLTRDMVKEGSVIIDVGINREDGALYGDVDFEAVSPVASYITPVPGGVGPMTVYELMENTYNAHILKMQKTNK